MLYPRAQVTASWRGWANEMHPWTFLLHIYSTPSIMNALLPSIYTTHVRVFTTYYWFIKPYTRSKQRGDKRPSEVVCSSHTKKREAKIGKESHLRKLIGKTRKRPYSLALASSCCGLHPSSSDLQGPESLLRNRRHWGKLMGKTR